MRFSDILASIIHDMKNSLGMVVNTLDELVIGNEYHENEKLSTLQHESKRLNNNLIALLSLYKIENEQLDANIEEINIDDFLEEIVVDNQTIAKTKGIRLDYQCEDALAGYFDEWLIRGVINNLIGNGLRYTSSRISIYAEMIENYLVFSIEDDGEGFPQRMIEAQTALNCNKSLSEGHTQLGIYFASMVARTHKNGDREGYIKLANNQRLKGGCFSIWLP
ncbi:MAG: HAMP domain-containing histidine kinase [Candidatus Thiodiazotropha sp. (ex Epidulcina cf. delphinae)]|nr:HAMP domain-containing histidine kinase [Candidatus Thiodiazotropha sp. (ex Epidulcina cf. delphinae)]